MKNDFNPTQGQRITANIRLERPLGEGGMGSVWVARHEGLDTSVAVKFVSADVPPSLVPMLLGRFEREARAAAKIRSPHVVEVKDFGTLEGGVPFLVMELLEGESLGQRLGRTGVLEPREAAAVVTQVAKALAAAHALGIRHRDIKPDNVFLARAHDEIVVKVLDFGIAKTSELGDARRELTGTQSMLGTPDYMSPEQLLSPKDADDGVDLWSLAVVAYEMLTGQVPFVGETLAALSIAITTGRFAPPSRQRPELPSSIDAWFGLALHPNPAMRFATAKELATTFTGAVDGIAPPLRPVSREMTRSPSEGPASGVSVSSRAAGTVARSPADLEGAAASSRGPASPPPLATIVGQPLADALLDSTRRASQPGIVATEIGQAPLRAGTEVSTLHGASHSLPGLPHPGEGLIPAPSLREARTVLPWPKLAAAGVLALALLGGLLMRRGADDESAPGIPSANPASTARPTSHEAKDSTTKAPPSGMAAFKAGDYTIGCDAGPGCDTASQPAHRVRVEAFALLANEVSMLDYDKCVAGGACPPAGLTEGCTWQTDGKEAHPITCVSFVSATAYCGSKGWRLPTEYEWEVAARHGEESPSSAPRGAPSKPRTSTEPVGSSSSDRTEAGVFDLRGNVREWTATDFKPYPGANEASMPGGKSVRGGSFREPTEHALTHRLGEPPTETVPDLGFRCAVSL
ncbi:MAG: SUMF1/EgtB/PvdO family nonheme iron enzyme [Deltaproteobacteria bacterium]|nr:SUMF1/EgtB/PvdO family nonheme iron enzyme [Deltaproteobacteria bacterium]